eukprot:s1700_g12.t1
MHDGDEDESFLFDPGAPGDDNFFVKPSRPQIELTNLPPSPRCRSPSRTVAPPAPPVPPPTSPASLRRPRPQPAPELDMETTEASKDTEVKPAPQTVPIVPSAFSPPAAPSVPDAAVKRKLPEMKEADAEHQGSASDVVPVSEPVQKPHVPRPLPQPRHVVKQEAAAQSQNGTPSLAVKLPDRERAKEEEETIVTQRLILKPVPALRASAERERHLQPAVQLLFVSQLARQLAKQLDCERGCCQPPLFEASVPVSDSQLEKLPVPEKLKSLCF